MVSDSFTGFVSTYASEHDIADSTAAQYLLAVKALERFAGRSLSLSDVAPDLINQHLRAMKVAGRADTTRHSRRRDLTLLLRAAIARGSLSGFDFDRVLRVNVKDRVTRAWTRAQVEHLLGVAGKMPGEFTNGIPRAAWWRSYILAAWDSGLRACDLLSIEHDWIAAGGCFTIIQHKTGRRHRVQFAHVTREAIAESMAAAPRRALVWPLWGRREVFAKWAKRLLMSAELPGTLKWLRRSSATELERDHPGSAGRHLGHKTPGMAERFYIDHDQLDLERPQPRPLNDPRPPLSPPPLE